MAILQQACAEYELSKYLQLFHGDEALLLAGNAAIRSSLNDRVELTVVRLAVQGAFVVLNDAKRLHFIAGSHRANADDVFSRVVLNSEDNEWLHTEGADRPLWISLLQEIIALRPSEPCPASERVFSIPALQRDPRTSQLSAVSGFPHLSFFAGTPLTSRNGHNIGAICVVDQIERPPLSASETAFLADTAQRLEELDVFLKSHSLRAQLFEEPQTLAGRKFLTRKKNAEKPNESGNERVDPHVLAEDSLADQANLPTEGQESERLVVAGAKQDHRIAGHDNARDARSLLAKRDKDDRRGPPGGETTYRKVFRRAAECLHSALQADGALFIDGLIGFHGDTQPVAEPEQELEREIARPLVHGKKSAQVDSLSKNDQTNIPEDTFKPHDSDPPGTHSRIYTSSEYLRGVYVERPAEILGSSGSVDMLKVVQISGSTIGLPDIDERCLQRLMDRHPKGAVWHNSNSGFRQVKDETLVDVDLGEETHRLKSTFKDIEQLIFKPLTDPTSLKRLGAFFAWRTTSVRLFTDVVDLKSLKAFLHVVESEIARYDAALAGKQRESFVSSVSHELRTPLHGILGAVQLLDETGLDPTQKSLAEMINTCGSTLHETLTIVLSYAKINQFERRQHEYRQRRPPDSSWALSEKQGLACGPDRDYEGLYICTNVALLCEEILGVLEAGKSFQNAHGNEVIVVCDIEYEENWNYHTEPGALRRITANLIGNALKYTNSGSVAVSLSATRLIKDNQRISNDLTSGNTLTFTFRDTGKGMSKEFMDNELFLPFTQEDSTSSNGVGLGMSIVKSLVSLLGGEIQVQSEENKGTEINVRIPMKLCSSDDREKGEPTLEFERSLQTIRDRKLSAVMYGFPQHVRNSLKGYLCDWYGCNLLEPTNHARPDVVMVDEGNEEVEQAVKKTAHAYGKHGVLLSIVMVPSRMGMRMDPIDGYIKWERVPRPLGPNNVAQGLLSCLDKLDELRKYSESASVDRQEPEKEPQPEKGLSNLQELKDSLPEKLCVSSLEEPQVSKATQTPPASSNSSKQSPAPNKSEDHETDSTSKTTGVLRILIVDDNGLNLKLLEAFFKKSGYHDTKQAKNGREAVEAAQNLSEGFDIIFMDLSMPIMDGFEATRQIRKMEAGHERAPSAKNSVIVALTGLASQEDEDEAFSAGVDLFLTKPVQFAKLTKLLRQYEEGTLTRC
ncbi:phosphorelay sensor kinase [Ascochyta rabiei]|uniref:Phosphorelay sensor kinase n=1 Tax=Didymella rabiei TaxID=5454 RepID=A0A163JMP4_DIDRA|nr:phosphorelay sensor kinase [Ascochyta rabiei]